MESGSAEEVPPPGVGLVTLTAAQPSAATLPASTVAVSCEALTNVVGRAVLFNCTVELDANPDPFTVRVNPPEPACTNAGEIELIAGFGLNAFPVTVVLGLTVLSLVFGSPCGAPTTAVLVRVPAASGVTTIATVAELPELIFPKLQRMTAPGLQVP